jgi:hypothetical protein
MSFDPIRFIFTPPPTIPPQAVLAPASNPVGVATPTSNQFGSPQAATSNAAALVTRLSNMTQTAAYLQQAIMSLVPNLGIVFDLSSNPDLSRALCRIYNTTTPPPAMDMTMYTTLMQTYTNFQQFDLLNASDSPAQILPTQRADVGLAVKSFQSSLISSGQYNQTIPILLNSLSGDQLIFNSWTNTLNQYPILAVPQKTPAQIASTASPTGASVRDLNGSSVDVSSSLTELMNGILDQWQSSYAGIYKVVASPDPTETALPSVVATLSTQPSSDLSRLSTMLENLIAFQHQPALQTAQDSVDNQILPKLMSQVVGHAGNMDYMTQVGITPTTSFGGAMAPLMASIASVNIGSILSIGITGTVAQASGGFAPPSITPAQAATLSGLPEGLQILGANVSWAQNESNRQNALLQQNIQRLALRRLSNQGSQTEMLTSLKSLSSSIGIIKSILQSGTNNPVASGNTTSLNTGSVKPAVGLESFGTLVSSLKSQSGSSFAVDGNTLTITPPQIPTAPTNVQTVLAAGGVNQITTQALQTTVNLNV